MGTLAFTVSDYGRNKGSGAATLGGTRDRLSNNAFTTSESAAAFVEASSTDIELAAGEVFEAYASEDMWLKFGGTAATVGGGFLLVASTWRQWECTSPGKVSVIDAA